MRRNQTNGNLAIASYNDIFLPDAPDPNDSGERVVNIPLSELFPPDFHPFQINEDQSMARLVKSVMKYGVREPGLVRPRSGGGYELVSGNRRKRACELAGADTMPVIIRKMDDDSAAIAMVDSNLEQREKLLFSEKAWAYRIKLEALNHRGAKSEEPGELSVQVLCEQTGESKNQIFRLIRLTYLVPDLSDKVDAKKLAFNPAVELSYLTRKEQAIVIDAMAKYDTRPSLSQAGRLKKISQGSGLTQDEVESVLSERKKASDNTKSAAIQFNQFFPDSYTPKQIEAVIVELLSGWQAGQTIRTTGSAASC